MIRSPILIEKKCLNQDWKIDDHALIILEAFFVFEMCFFYDKFTDFL